MSEAGASDYKTPAMIITDQFVFVHMPKTGGTFVESVLERIHHARGDRIVEQRYDLPARSTALRRLGGRLAARLRPPPRGLLIQAAHRREGTFNQHGTVAQIPAAHADKPILTVLRNPYDRYVSQYAFKWWVEHPTAFTQDLDRVRAEFPRYPELTFDEYVALSNRFFRGSPNRRFPWEDRLGRHTLQFAEYCFADPARAAAIDAASLEAGLYRQDLHPRLRVIFQENLNRELHDFLLEQGYAPAEIGFILDHDRILPPGSSRPAAQGWESYYTPALKAEVRRRERMLFALYPQWDV